MKDINILFRKAIIFGLIVFVLDLSLGEGLRFLYFRRAHGDRKNIINIMEKTTAPILIFGSSRAQHHYISSCFQAAFNKECFNAGLDGTSIEYHEAVLEAVLARYLPSMIILNFSPDEFSRNKKRLQALTKLLPFYRRHNEIRTCIHDRGLIERFKMASHIYPFNSEIIHQIFWNLLSEKRYFQNNYDDGYVPLSKVSTVLIKELDRYNYKEEYDSNAIRLFNAFIVKCIERNINLFVIVSPLFIKTNPLYGSIAIAAETCRRESVPFFDLSNNEAILAHPEYFQDKSHMNDKGALAFSKIVTDLIRPIIDIDKKLYDLNN